MPPDAASRRRYGGNGGSRCTEAMTSIKKTGPAALKHNTLSALSKGYAGEDFALFSCLPPTAANNMTKRVLGNRLGTFRRVLFVSGSKLGTVYRGSGGILRQGVRVRYVFVYRHRYEYPVRLCCRVLEVSHSGYYAYLRRRGNSIRDAELIALLREAHRRSRYTYGSRRLMHQLRRKGLVIGRYRVRRLMGLAEISVRKRRRYKVTTRSSHRYPVSPNLIQGCFQTAKPNLVWVSDITYIKTMEGWGCTWRSSWTCTRARS